jgi:superfamily I DNA/RNA helicase
MSQTDLFDKSPLYIKAAEELRGNEGQLAAYESTGHCVALAGPGSGKTKTLTVKLAKILSEDVVAPRGVACITYSNQCARELKKRLKLLGVEENARVYIGTVHSFCFRMVVLPYARLAGLNLPDPVTVASKSEQERLLDEALTYFDPRGNPAYKRTPCSEFRKTVLDRNSQEWLGDVAYRPAIELYEQKLIDSQQVDFDGMVLMALKLINECHWVRKALKAKYPVLVVDEYQDLGVPLHNIVEKLCLEEQIRLFAVGDPDQSIYGFNGSRPNLLEDLAKHPGIEQVRLTLNYRCGSDIIKASSALLGPDIESKASGAQKGIIFAHECEKGIEDQLDKVFSHIIPDFLERSPLSKLGDVGILYTNQFVGQQVAEAAKAAGYDYVRFDQGNPYPRTPFTTWLEECAAWCSGGWKTGEPKLSSLIYTWLQFNPSLATDSEIANNRKILVNFLFSNRNPEIPLHKWFENFQNTSILDNFKKEPTYVDEYDTFNTFYARTLPDEPLEMFTVQIFGGQKGSPDHLNLTTMHSSKGLEYDMVIMIGLEEGVIPRTYRATETQIAESKRLFYVSLTRARHEVHMLWSGWFQTKGYTFREGRSRFVADVLNKISSAI